MESVLAEMPLALFTTLAPIGAGAFIVTSLARQLAPFSAEEGRKADLASIAALVLLAIAFVAASFHLTNPLHAVHALNGLGRSPLTNEVAVGGVFFVLAIAYVALASRSEGPAAASA